MPEPAWPTEDSEPAAEAVDPFLFNWTGAIGLAALRGSHVVGEHSLIFAAGSEHIVLTHRAFDRRAFATGAARAALWAVSRPPRLYSMMDVLGIA